MTNRTSRIAVAAAMAAGFAVAVANPVFADVTVTVDVDKTKTITVTEIIHKDKSVTATIDVIILDADGVAEAQALANVLNQGNSVNLDGVSYIATMQTTVVGNRGITQVSQAAGNMHNQGNLVAVALTAEGDSFANAQAEVQQDNLNTSPTSLVIGSTFVANMPGSVVGNLGVTQVNQDAGNMNNQTNAVAVAAGIASTNADVLVALAESALGQTSSDHLINESNNVKDAQMVGAVTDNTGITHVNQAVGMFADQANVVSIGAAVVSF